MRLPLAHPPPSKAPAVARCHYLQELALASVGLPLAQAAHCLMGSKGRGRHGNALQWHLGLDVSDARPQLDWEDRIEIKLVSVWARADGTWICDKLKVCDHGVDPWHKLSNVLWVLADRCTRVVLGSTISTLGGPMWEAMHRAWHCDPHFDQPDLFVESRDKGKGMSPAYYLSASIMRKTVVAPLSRLPGARPLAWSSKLAQVLREDTKKPVWILIDAKSGLPNCPQCGCPLLVRDLSTLDWGWTLLHHAGDASGCQPLRWIGVDGSMIPESPVLSRSEQAQALLGLPTQSPLLRLADRCMEPEDHGH